MPTNQMSRDDTTERLVNRTEQKPWPGGNVGQLFSGFVVMIKLDNPVKTQPQGLTQGNYAITKQDIGPIAREWRGRSVAPATLVVDSRH